VLSGNPPKHSYRGIINEESGVPTGSPDDVAREVRERIGIIGRGGGLIVGPTHHVQLDTPMENFWAMVRAVRETPCTEIWA
jgi:uroporphyrinogen decarboxylase